MARGWESKSVEEQIEATREGRQESKGTRVSKPGPPSREKESLLLARTRVLRDLETTQNDRYRQFLKTSLEAIEAQLLEIK
jgi:hypothetical protein